MSPNRTGPNWAGQKPQHHYIIAFPLRIRLSKTGSGGTAGDRDGDGPSRSSRTWRVIGTGDDGDVGEHPK